MWQLGTTTWAFAGPSRIVVAHARNGRWRLGTIDLETGAFDVVPTDIEPGESVAATKTHAIVLGGGPRRPDAILRVDLATGATETLRRSCDLSIEPGFLSDPKAIEFPTTATTGGTTAHAFFYAPTNRDFAVPEGERPPLIVSCHGGPTAAANARLSLEVQYWTSRGFAVVDVNCGGSASYGREYRRRLQGRWGIVDVADAASAVRHVVGEGRADANRVAIHGRSAGGYTTLAALVFESATFKAGASYYGIGDLELLAKDTHKFESRYLDGLVGPYPAARDLYRSRSPIHHLERLASPLILFQGLEDRVVPPNQAQLMADAVRSKGIPVALLTFAGEQHGFRRADTIVRSLQAELAFYGAIFGFVPPDTPPLKVDNFDRREPPVT
jgi:dipeptidyl aminopeptidase/acylaminoacyl peptidase